LRRYAGFEEIPISRHAQNGLQHAQLIGRMLRIDAQSEQQGIERDLHNPGGSESIALFSVGHAHNVNALRQTLEQGRDATAHISRLTLRLTLRHAQKS